MTKGRLPRGWLPYGSLRYRLLALVLVPLLLLAVTVVLFSARWTTDYTYQQLFTKVNTDLRVAHDSFQRVQIEQQRSLMDLADHKSLSVLLSEPIALHEWIEEQRDQLGYDYLMLLSADGSERLASTGWVAHEVFESASTDTLFDAASNGLGGTGIEVLPPSVWQDNGLLSTDQVLFPLIETPRATPTDRSVENRAMVIRSFQSVRDQRGARLGVLEGGRLLNRDFGFVDRIRDLVYGPGSLAPGSLGTVTIFLDDVRITTNVPSTDDTRALGTRVSTEVRETVLQNGQLWIDRAFVVNDWYISAYEPIIDVNGERVGMLYAGYLEAPFRHELFKAITVLSALVLVGCLFAIVVAGIGARSIFRPIESMSSVVRATAAGKHRRVGDVESVDEIRVLASQFDEMLDTLGDQRSKIEQDALLLEDKVQLRTVELRQQNQRLVDSMTLLKQTRQQLETAERLASLGELTAGVAHEINNPTAVILGNMDILISEMGDQRHELQTEIDLIIQQVYRIRSITHRLLQCSRSDSVPVSPVNQAVMLSDLVGNTVELMRHDFAGDGIRIREHHASTQPAAIDAHELQQVLVNIVRNAVEAIEGTGQDTGTIRIETRDLDQHEVAIAISDTGGGIEPSHRSRLFDPFFTAGKEHGTGLGLSVSYGIVQRHGGRIDVESRVDAGSTFTVVLPVAPDVEGVSPSSKVLELPGKVLPNVSH